MSVRSVRSARTAAIVGSCVTTVTRMPSGSDLATAKLVEPASIKTSCPLNSRSHPFPERKLSINSLLASLKSAPRGRRSFRGRNHRHERTSPERLGRAERDTKSHYLFNGSCVSRNFLIARNQGIRIPCSIPDHSLFRFVQEVHLLLITSDLFDICR
jgi:hypothetical protein